jgi:hypothetical protein
MEKQGGSMGTRGHQVKAGLIFTRALWEDKNVKLALKALSGPRKDEVFPLSDGLTLGRKGDIQLEDFKVSGQHAHVSLLEDGAWFLKDKGSKNGIRVNGEKVEQVALSEGAKFWIGDSEFEVLSIIPEIKPKPSKNQRYWHEVLAEFLNHYADKFKDRPRPMSPLDPALVLEFVRGTQVNSKWILGFGPRKIGSNSVDLPIWEPGAPAVCFEVLPSHDGLLFRTKHPDIVKLNGEEVDSQVLRMGDTIRILDTVIEVDFTE